MKYYRYSHHPRLGCGNDSFSSTIQSFPIISISSKEVGTQEPSCPQKTKIRIKLRTYQVCPAQITTKLMKNKPAMKGSAVRKVSKSTTGNPWLNLPIAEKIRRHKTSPPARNPTCLNNSIFQNKKKAKLS